MRNMYLLQLLFILPLFIQAQQAKPVRFMVYGGTGISIPSGYMKEHSQFGNGIGFRGGMILPVASINKTTRVAMEIGMDYSKYTAQLKAPASVSNIVYYNGAANVPVVFHIDPGTKKPDAFRFLAGPSLLREKNKLLWQFSLLAGYASVSQEPFSFSDSIHYVPDPSRDASVSFYASGHATNNGFLLVPDIKCGWRLLRQVCLLLSANYSFGSVHRFSDRILTPAGAPASGVYQFDQLKNGSFTTRLRESRLNALSFQALLGWTF